MGLLIIECGENCYSISRKGIDDRTTNGSQQIALSRLEWVQFIKLCDDVTAYMEGESQTSKNEDEMIWPLPTENSRGVEGWKTMSTKVRLFHTKKTPYCNITTYEGMMPSNQGVTLNRHEWEQVRVSTALSSSFNVYLALNVYRDLLRDAVLRALPEHCDGCKEDRVVGMEHECLVDKERLIRRVVRDLADTAVSPYVFQHELSQLAHCREEELKLSPAYLYALCNSLFRPECVDELCASKTCLRFTQGESLGQEAAEYIRRRSTHTSVVL